MPNIDINGNDFHYLEIEGDLPSILMLCSTGLDSSQRRDAFPLICLLYKSDAADDNP